MDEYAKNFFENFKGSAAKMSEQMPDVASGFRQLFAKTMKEGSVSVLEKELIAVGIAVAIQCDPCIRLHVQKALDAGATKEQILEASGVSLMMAGGPAYTHIPVVIETLDALQ